jgi:hypothetical protein
VFLSSGPSDARVKLEKTSKKKIKKKQMTAEEKKAAGLVWYVRCPALRHDTSHSNYFADECCSLHCKLSNLHVCYEDHIHGLVHHPDFTAVNTSPLEQAVQRFGYGACQSDQSNLRGVFRGYSHK